MTWRPTHGFRCKKCGGELNICTWAPDAKNRLHGFGCDGELEWVGNPIPDPKQAGDRSTRDESS